MEKVKIELEVPKSVYDLLHDTVALIDLVDEQLENGFQPVEDGSAVVFSKELVSLVKSMANYKLVRDAIKEDPEGSAVAFLLAAKDAVKAIKD